MFTRHAAYYKKSTGAACYKRARTGTRNRLFSRYDLRANVYQPILYHISTFCLDQESSLFYHSLVLLNTFFKWLLHSLCKFHTLTTGRCLVVYACGRKPKSPSQHSKHLATGTIRLGIWPWDLSLPNECTLGHCELPAASRHKLAFTSQHHSLYSQLHDTTALY